MPSALVAKKGIKQTDEGAVAKAVDEAIAGEPRSLEEFRIRQGSRAQLPPRAGHAEDAGAGGSRDGQEIVRGEG